MLSWIKAHPGIVAVFAVISMAVALGSAADSWRTRKLLREQQEAQENVLKDAAKEKAKELQEADEAYIDLLKGSDKKLAAALKGQDALKQQLARATAEKFAPPGSVDEVVARWRRLGYVVGVGPCK